MRKIYLYTLVFPIFLCFITYAQAPTANFKSDISGGCSPIVVNFTDLSTGGPTSWVWDFGNGGTSTKKNPSTTYFASGTYTVTLTATNVNGSSTFQSLITVSDPPHVDFKWDKNSGCTPYRIQFTDLSIAASGTSNTGWNWDFGDGTQSTVQNPSHIYRVADNFTVTLKVTNDKGCSKTITKPNIINIIPGVNPSFNSSIPAVCSAPATVDFTNTSSGPGTLSYSWNFGDGGTSSTPSPSHTFSTNGKFMVSLATTSSLGCSDTTQREIEIGGFKTNFGVPVICMGKNVKFIDSSAPKPISSLWKFPDGTTDTTRNAVHSFPKAGNLQVTLINNYGTCTDSITKTISVTANPIVDFTSADTVKCQPSLTSNFTNQSNGSTYVWNFGDSATSTSPNPVHTFTKFGNYTVSLVATNAQGCIDSTKKVNYIRIQKPVINFPNLPQRGCIPYLASFDAAFNMVDKVASYRWEFGDGTASTLPKPTHTYNKRGTYDVTLTITTSTGCTEKYTLKEAVKVGTQPTIDFTVDQTNVCASTALQFKDLSTPVDSVNEWKWEFGDGGISTAKNPIYRFTDTGWKDVKLTVFNNGCPSTLLTKKNLVHIKPPIARFDYRPDCNARWNYTFTDKSIDAKSWEWDFGDGSPKVFSQNPGLHTFPAGFNSYTASLKVTNGACDFTVQRVISIIDKTPDFTVTSAEGCKPFSTHLTASSPDNGSIKLYTWDFGNGITADGADGYPVYNNAGYYDVKLTSIDSFNCIDTKLKAKFIRVNGPLADFSSINNQGCRGMTTNFTDKTITDGTHPIVNWTWNFGDSTVQTFTAPPFQHLYDTIGNLDVVLEVKDSYGCVDSIRKKDFVKLSIIKANWNAQPQTCPGAAQTFSNATPGSYTSIWDFGDGNTSTVASPTYTYADTGTFTIKLKVRDPIGCEDSLIRTNFLQVYKPRADFDANNLVSYCLPFEAKFTNTSNYYNDRIWDLGIAVSRQENPTIYYTSKGVYNIKLKITSPGGCQDSITKQLQTFNQSDAKMTYSPTSGCAPLNVAFDALTPMKASFIWDFGDGNVIDTTINKLDHVYTDFGDFIPKMIFTASDDPNCKLPLTGTTMINVLGAKAKFGINKNLFCDSGYLYITDSTTFNDPIISYNWDYGDGIRSSIPSDTIHPYTKPGNYSVLLTVTTANNCIDTVRSKPIKVVESPLIHIASDTVICAGERMRHAGVFDRTDTSAVKWVWQFPNGNNAFVQFPANQQYDSAGNYLLKTIAVNSSGCTDSDSINLLVNPLPTVAMPSALTMQAGFPVLIPAKYTSNVIGYAWLPDNNTLSCVDCPQPTTTNTKFTTKYTVNFVDSNGCKNTGDVQVIVICKNANVFAPNTFSPNGDGSNDVFYIRGKGIERVKSLRIFNRWGEVVFEKRDFPVNDALSGWNGTYKGNKPHPDVYIYQVEVFCDNSEVIRFEGNVALIQ